MRLCASDCGNRRLQRVGLYSIDPGVAQPVPSVPPWKSCTTDMELSMPSADPGSGMCCASTQPGDAEADGCPVSSRCEPCTGPDQRSLCPLSLRTSGPSSRAAFHHVRSVTSVIPDASANARIRRFADAPICSIAQYSSSHADCRTGAMRCPAHGIRNAKAGPFGTSRHRPRIRDYENGCSSEGLCGVNRLAPFSVMYMSSSRRTPNSPGM